MKNSFSILIPHYKAGHATAHAVAKVLQHSGEYDLQIIVIDNSPGDTSINHILMTNLRHFCQVVHYPADKLQSHGIALDYVLAKGLVKNEWFIMLESDAYPSQDNWLEHYDNIIDQGFKAAGSLLQLSGGLYLHPAGALYNQPIWKEAYDYCRKIEQMYYYFPNMIMKNGHPCHAMVKKGLFLDDPQWDEAYQFHQEYLTDGRLDTTKAFPKGVDYSPTINPFHNGMGNNQEDISTYGQRTIASQVSDVILDGKEDVILRLGEEPGQWFCSWMLAKGYPLAEMDTEVKWMPGRENQQQEYTITETSVIHAWGISSYFKANIPGLEDIVAFKNQQMVDLYNQLPEAYKL